MNREYELKREVISRINRKRLDRLLQLFRQLDDAESRYDAPTGLVPNSPTDAQLRKWFRKRKTVITASDRDGNILGYLHNGRADDWKNAGFVSSLIVDREHRGMGIGRALLRKAMEENRKRKLKTVLSVSLNNPVGKGLYESEGFKPINQIMMTEDR